jgi:RNA-binding protein
MYELSLTGRQKTRLRGQGQKLQPSLKIGKAGLTPTFLLELQRQLNAAELVKLRFLGLDRHEIAALADEIAREGRCIGLGTMGHTALFYRPNPTPALRQVRTEED